MYYVEEKTAAGFQIIARYSAKAYAIAHAKTQNRRTMRETRAYHSETGDLAASFPAAGNRRV